MTHVLFAMGLTALLHLCSFAVMAEPRYTPRRMAVIYSAFWLAFILSTMAVYTLFGYEAKYSIPIAYGGTIIIAFIMFMVVSVDFFSKKLFLFVNYASVFCIMVCISMLVFDSMSDTLIEVNGMFGRNTFRFALYAILIFVYYKFLRKHVRAISGGKKWTWYSLTLVSVLFLLVFSIFVIVISRGGITAADEVALFVIVVVIYCSVLWVVFRTIRYMSDESQMEMAGKNVEYLREQLDLVREKEMEARTVRHDIRHHNRNVARLLYEGKVQEAIKYVKQYDESLQRSKPMIFCPNTTVNAILSDFYTKATNEGMQVLIAADLPEETKVSDLDYVAILSNILENAVNACRKYEALGEISVDIRIVADKMVIVCSNPCGTDVIVENGMIKDRGIGIYSILLAVEKYKGDIRYTLENNTMTVCVILNN